MWWGVNWELLASTSTGGGIQSGFNLVSVKTSFRSKKNSLINKESFLIFRIRKLWNWHKYSRDVINGSQKIRGIKKIWQTTEKMKMKQKQIKEPIQLSTIYKWAKRNPKESRPMNSCPNYHSLEATKIAAQPTILKNLTRSEPTNTKNSSRTKEGNLNQ